VSTAANGCPAESPFCSINRLSCIVRSRSGPLAPGDSCVGSNDCQSGYGCWGPSPDPTSVPRICRRICNAISGRECLPTESCRPFSEATSDRTYAALGVCI
jgi:hypothetical protein